MDYTSIHEEQIRGPADRLEWGGKEREKSRILPGLSCLQ